MSKPNARPRITDLERELRLKDIDEIIEYFEHFPILIVECEAERDDGQNSDMRRQAREREQEPDPAPERRRLQ